MSFSRVLALIPARGGSKGVPKKNIRPLGGRPLIAHTIAVARASRLIDRIIVSTDDPAIAEIARAAGAEAPFLRPARLAQDLTPDLPVFQHALAWLREQGERPELVVHLRPTSPLRAAADVDGAIALLQRHPEADSVRSVSLVREHPAKMWRLGRGRLTPFLADRLAPGAEPYNWPRQRLPEVYIHNGAVDVVRARVIARGSMTGKRILPWVMPHERAVDLDTVIDFQVAEQFLKARR